MGPANTLFSILYPLVSHLSSFFILSVLSLLFSLLFSLIHTPPHKTLSYPHNPPSSQFHPTHPIGWDERGEKSFLVSPTNITSTHNQLIKYYLLFFKRHFGQKKKKIRFKWVFWITFFFFLFWFLYFFFKWLILINKQPFSLLNKTRIIKKLNKRKM